MLEFYRGKIFFCLIVIASFNFSASAQITTYAGRHFYLGDNGTAINAGLFGPYAIAMDAAGNMYIATSKDNRVRRVDAATKAITTIAGTGIAGFSGDGGLATAAQLNFTNSGLPGIAVDKNGNIYIGDYFNNRVRRIDGTTKIITTIAGTGAGGHSGDGGVATLAKLSGPAGVAVDTAGNVYIVDYNTSCVRKVTIKTSVITTIAGVGNGATGYTGDNGPATSATLNYPERLTVDIAGHIYISDEYNSAIRMVDTTTGKITTIAGTGTPGSSGDNGPAASATLNYPVGITVDASGNIYIADQSNNKVRKITAATKKISTIAGTGVKGYSGDGSTATSAQLNNLSDVAADAGGNVYIVDFGNNVIRQIASATNVITTVTGDGTDGFTGAPAALKAQIAPQAVAIDAAGTNLFIADGYYYDVRTINAASSSYAYAGSPNPDYKYASKGYNGNGGNAAFALYNAPFGVAVDAANNVYIADVFNNVIRKITYSTKVVTNFAGNATAGYSGDGGAATSAQLNNPYGIAVDKNGNIYIADALNNRIRKVTTANIISTIAGGASAGSTGDGGFATSALLNNPRGIAVDANLNVFILDKGNNKIRMINASTLKIATIFSNGDVLTGVATDAAGNIFVSDSTTATIIKITASTYTANVVAGTGTPGYSGDGGDATSGQLNYPGGLAVNSAGNIFVADINNNVIRKIIPSTVIATAIKNNVISTTDSAATCTGKINITTLTGSLPAGGTGNYTYKWLQSPDSVNYSPVAGAVSQNYTVGATIQATVYYRRLVNSGTYSDSGNVIAFHVHINPVPVITTGALAICRGAKDTLSTSAAYTKYVWSTGAVTRQITDSVKGIFYVSVTDANGCTGTSAPVSITVNNLPAKPTITSLPVTTTGLCTGTQVTLTSSTALIYAWSNGRATQAITVNTAGAYSVTVKDANGCTNKSVAKSVTYKACGAPAVLSVLSVSTTSAVLKWTGVSCAVKYRLQYALAGTANWAPAATGSDTTYILTGLTAATQYSWRVASICQASPLIISAYKNGTDFKTAADNPIGNNVISTTDTITTCTGKIHIATLAGALPTGGTGAYTYKWLQSTNGINYSAITGAGLQSYRVGANITATAYYRRLVSSGAYSDSGNVLAFHVYTKPVPVIITGALAICKGVKDTLTTSAPFSNYVWNTGAVTRQITDSLKGTFYVTVTDANGCTGKSATVSITVNNLPARPTITAAPVTTTNLCAGTAVTFTSSAAVQYTWSDGATTKAITVNTAGAYTVTVKDANGCANTSVAKNVTYKACAAPVSTTVPGKTGTTATLSWRSVPCAVKYQLQYALNGTTVWTTITTPTADTTYTLTGLTKSTTYLWKVSTVCQLSPLVTSAYKAGVNFRTTAANSLSGETSLFLLNESSAPAKGFDATVFPNPATSSARLNISGPASKVAVTITDMSGRVIWKTDVEGSTQINLPAEKLAAGMYFITVCDEKYKKVLKLVKQ